jgi:hypothetical protein
VLYYGGLQPAPGFYIQQPSGAKIYNPVPSPNAQLDIAAGSVAPGLVVGLAGSAPDYIGWPSQSMARTAVCKPARVPNIATWQSAGAARP